MNKKVSRYLLMPLIALTLVSCKGAVREVYQGNEFHTQDFVANYYTIFPDELKDVKYAQNETIIDLLANQFTQKQVFSNAYYEAIFKDFTRGFLSYQDMIDLYGDQTIKQMQKDGRSEFEIAEALPNSTKATWYEYAKHHKLSNYNDSFKSGIFSKLTEGLLSCDGSGSLVRIQINEDGFGKIFDYELNQYDSLTISLRGGTDIPYGTTGLETRINTASIDLTVDFYIPQNISNEARKVSFTFPIDDLVTDKSLETNIIHLYFDEVMTPTELQQIKRANAISINYELRDHSIIKPAGVDNPNNDYAFAVMLYEVMLPNSVWN